MGMPNKPCNECPFRIQNIGRMCAIMVDQMEDNAQYLKGFPRHKLNPGNDILTCESPEANANDCMGYKMMLENRESDSIVHPDVVNLFDELIA